MQIELVVYGKKYHKPKQLDLDFGCLWIPNPHGKLVDLTGFDEQVKALVRSAPAYHHNLGMMVGKIIYHAANPKRVGIHCLGGKHRSVVVANDVAEMLRGNGHIITITYMNAKVKK